jgi:hypothetical protein
MVDKHGRGAQAARRRPGRHGKRQLALDPVYSGHGNCFRLQRRCSLQSRSTGDNANPVCADVSQHLRHATARTMLQRVGPGSVVGSLAASRLQVSAARQNGQEKQEGEREQRQGREHC